MAICSSSTALLISKSRASKYSTEPDIELHGTDAALSRLADSFRAWLNTHFPEGENVYTEKELEAATTQLHREITSFMQQMGDK